MNEENEPIKYFIYARKSSENEDRQMNSIEDQIAVLTELATRNNLKIIDILCEAYSAKKPGREVFNKMMERFDKGEANGILCWKLNRLARNPIDGGSISWALQNSIIQRITTPNREYKPTDNVLMMQVEFGMSNQFILDLRKDSMRGTLRKAENGWLPSRAPLGYKNFGTEQGSKTIIPDEKRFELVREMWEMVLAGIPLVNILNTANSDWGMTTPRFKRSGGNALSRTQVYDMFSNVFYTGKFRYRGKIYKGKHKAMITEEEFEKVQSILGRKDRPRPSKYNFAYTGFIKCGCGCNNSITAYTKNKTQKMTGEKKSYIYYCSTKSKKGTNCKQQQISEKELQTQILVSLEKINIHPEILEWAYDIIDRKAEIEKSSKEKATQMRTDNIKSKEQELSNLKYMRIKDFINDKEFLTEKEKLEKDISVLKRKKINDIEIDEKAKELKNELSIMSEAKRQMLESDNPGDRKKILSYFGTNHTLKNKQFQFIVRTWQYPVLTSYRKVEKEIKKLEPTKHYIKQRKNKDLLLACPVLGHMIDEVWKNFKTEN